MAVQAREFEQQLVRSMRRVLLGHILRQLFDRKVNKRQVTTKVTGLKRKEELYQNGQNRVQR